MPVKFWQTIVRFWFFLSYLITIVQNVKIKTRDGELTKRIYVYIFLSALRMIGKENGAAVSSRISNVRRRSLVQGSGSAVRFFGTKKPLKSDIRTVEGHLTEPKQTNKIITGDTKKWKKTTNSFEMSVLKKQKQARKEVRYVFM